MPTSPDAPLAGVAIDFRSPAVIANPWPAFHHLMEHEPVHWNEGLGAWCLTRYADVTWALKDGRFSSDRIRPFIENQRRVPADVVKPLGDVLSLWSVFNDPPAHTRLRRLMNKGFTPRAIAGLRPTVAALVAELLAAFPADGEIDFIRAFAAPLPALVIAEILGVPREDLAALTAWSNDVAEFVLVSRTGQSKYERAARSLDAMCGYFRALVDRRRAEPGGKVIDDLIAAHEDRDALSAEELVAASVLLLFAGHETTTHFLANGLWALLAHPEAYAELAARAGDPATVGRALDEMLRWDGPSIMQLRVLADEVELHGARLAAGERVVLFNGAANRDPREFAEPDRFDLARPNAHRQIAFGHGIHFCLGAHLARLEGEVAFPALLDRIARAELVDPAPAWTDSLVIRGMARLPLRVRLKAT